jgi:hypothetical protein
MVTVALRDAADFDGLWMVLKSQAGWFQSSRRVPICSVLTSAAANAHETEAASVANVAATNGWRKLFI